MTKISEAIKHYESFRKKIGIVSYPTPKIPRGRLSFYTDVTIKFVDGKLDIKPIKDICLDDLYLGDPDVSAKIQTLTLIQEAIGDVDLTDKYLKAYMQSLKSFPFKTPYERKLQKVRIIYELSKDTKMTTEELLTLIQLYHSGAYTLMYEEIKELIVTHKDLKSGLELVIGEAIKYGLEESKKLECLKEEYSKEFIEQIKQVVREECISSDKVLEILPSKTFIDASVEDVPGLGYTISSGEDLVLRRLKYIRVEDDYQTALADEKVALGFSSTGDIVYTSFTKGEYEEELKSGKKLIRKK